MDIEAEAHPILSGRHPGYLPDHMAATLSARTPLRAIWSDLFSYKARFQIDFRPGWRPNRALSRMVALMPAQVSG